MSGFREKVAKYLSPGLKDEAEVREVVKEEIRRAEMAVPYGVNYDPKNEGYRRLTDFETRVRDLMPVSQDRMFEIAYFMWDNSPMFKRLARLDKTFLFAEGFEITSANDAVKDVLDNFCEHPGNRLALDFPDLIMWLGLLGEQCWPVTVNKQNGAVRLMYADPASIDEIKISSINIKQAVRVDMKGAGGRPGKKHTVIREDGDPASKTYGRLAGDCFFFAINKPPNATRGRSDFLTLFDWIDGMERYGFNFLERAELMLNFIWDVLLKGMSREEIEEWVRDNPPPQPGSLRAHNENVEWAAVAPELKAPDYKQGFDMVKSFIMGGAGRPDSWFGEGGKAYQTEADLLGLVPMKDLDERQKLAKHILENLCRFVVDQAVIHGRLSESDAGEGFDVSMPEISKKDFTNLINGVPQLSTALQVAETSRWITNRTAAKAFATALSQIGVEIDVEAELEELGKLPAEDETDYDEYGA